MCKDCKYWKEKIVVIKDGKPVSYGVCLKTNAFIERKPDDESCSDFEPLS